MTTPTNEEVRRQFEAWSRSGEGLNLCYVDNRYTSTQTRSAWNAYQAALSSPALVALVEADKEYDEAAQAFTNARPYTDEAIAALERVEAVSAKRHAALAALAPFTTGAGHVE